MLTIDLVSIHLDPNTICQSNNKKTCIRQKEGYQKMRRVRK